MSQASEIRRIIKNLKANKEYSYTVFKDFDPSTVRQTIKRSKDIVGTTTNGKIYKKLSRTNSRSPYLYSDNIEIVLFNPKEFTFNAFWQSSKPRKIKVIAIIRNYLSTMDEKDIALLCKKFGKPRVKSELVSMYKEEYQKGYVNIKGTDYPLNGRYDRNPSFKEILGIINDC